MTKLLQNPFVRKWFLSLLAFVAMLFISFTLYTYTNSKHLLQSEFTYYSELQTDKITSYLDDSFYSYNQIIALLSLNSQMKMYLFDDNAVNLFPDLYKQISSQLLSYKQSFNAIDSIYLYPASGTEVFASSIIDTDPKPLTLAMDEDAFLLYEQYYDTETRLIFPRKKSDFYPYLITILYPMSQAGEHSMIAINIDVSKIPVLHSSKNNSYQSIYIISDDGELVYRSGQQDMPESLNTVEELKHFDSSKASHSIYVNSESPYVYIQQHSQTYPWYYVTVTYTQSYVNKTYNLYSSLITFLPWLILLSLVVTIWLAILATHPIRTISDFLEDPLSGVPQNISEPETDKMIRQFINYIQANKNLSDELKSQMEQQNRATFLALQSQINPHFLFNTLSTIRYMEIETLGYDHEAPNLTLNLSRLLRYAINSTELVPLKVEIYNTEIYFNILNQRYSNKLELHIHQSDEASNILVPKLIIQPLIENAVFHGCSPQLETSNQLLIDATVRENRCILMVKDNGMGIASDRLEELRKKVNDIATIPGNSIGLQNVALRMHLTYGDAFEIIIDSVQGQGTCITLSFPASPTTLE